MTSFKLLAIISLALLNYSCNPNKFGESTYSVLSGDWIERPFVNDVDFETSQKYYNGRPFTFRYTGYEFLENRIVNVKNGFTRRVYGNTLEEDRFVYLGTSTEYKIENDSLCIYNPIDSSWYNRKIIALAKDTLRLLAKTGEKQEFIRRNYDIDSTPKYSTIVLSSSGCYGFCPSLNITIKKDGLVYFIGQKYTSKIGFFTGSINSKQYEVILNNFRKSNIETLKSDYEAGHTDDQTITTSFIRNDTIFKSVKDYGRYGPRELTWAYIPLINLYESLKLKEIPLDSIPEYLQIELVAFTKKTEKWDLIYSESFLLWSDLMRGKIVNESFKAKYRLEHFGRWIYSEKPIDINSIESDGRYYRFISNNKKPIIIDIGYNFVDNNFKIAKFKPITQ